jgi:hypothetical protein
MDGATEYGEAGESENAGIPDISGDSQNPAEAEPISQAGHGGADGERVDPPYHTGLSATPVPSLELRTKPILQRSARPALAPERGRPGFPQC